MKKNLRDLLIPNIREIEQSDEDLRKSDLYESMKAYGWNEEFPALVDEDGMVLVGHRRMRVAKELGIAAVTKTLTLGKGAKADAERVKLALISNIGFDEMKRGDYERIATILYSKDWSMAAIAKALDLSTATVSRTLDVSHDEKRGGTDSLGRRKGGGRPKGSKNKAKLPVPPPKVTPPECKGEPDCPDCGGTGTLTGIFGSDTKPTTVPCPRTKAGAASSTTPEPSPEESAEERKRLNAAAEDPVERILQQIEALSPEDRTRLLDEICNKYLCAECGKPGGDQPSA
jgi:hypothetical protein